MGNKLDLHFSSLAITGSDVIGTLAGIVQSDLGFQRLKEKSCDLPAYRFSFPVSSLS